MKAFKGFNPDLSCRGFQFKEGETFEHDGPVEVCQSGFHAVTMPLDVLRYYSPNRSVYHEVEVDDDAQRHGDDSKVASRTVKVGAKIDLTAHEGRHGVRAVRSGHGVREVRSGHGVRAVRSGHGVREVRRGHGVRGEVGRCRVRLCGSRARRARDGPVPDGA